MTNLWRHVAAFVLGGACLGISIAMPPFAPVLIPVGGTLLTAVGTSLLDGGKKAP